MTNKILKYIETRDKQIADYFLIDTESLECYNGASRELLENFNKRDRKILEAIEKRDDILIEHYSDEELENISSEVLDYLNNRDKILFDFLKGVDPTSALFCPVDNDCSTEHFSTIEEDDDCDIPAIVNDYSDVPY